jgi:hypothetical protein
MPRNAIAVMGEDSRVVVVDDINGRNSTCLGSSEISVVGNVRISTSPYSSKS